MQQTVHSTATAPGRDSARLRRTVLTLAVSAGLALGAAACGGGPASPGASGATGNVTAGGTASGGSGQRSSGTFSLAFARCMRAHGVPNFPDPNGQAGQLGPASGIDPSSPRFQAALNGPCKSLAPPGWLNTGSGPVTR
ncbi:MAG: hypothetical protein ACRDPY_20580 [Streptosporangiaceae bacterium]